MILRAESLGRDYPTADGQLTVLDGIDLAIAAGERVALVGASGSGKSTLLGLLAGLDRPSRGRVLAGERDLAALSDAEASAFRGARMGFVFQAHRLLPALSALDNVRAPLDLAGAADAGPRATACLERVGLGRRLGHRPRQLSGGEQQRVAVARALVHAPAIVFADEPTGSLDRRTGDDIADLLFALAAERGATVVLVTHEERLAARCDRTVRLADGRLVP